MNYLEAKDETYKVFYEAFKIVSAEVLGYEGKIYWDGIEDAGEPEKDKHHIRTSFTEITSPQKSFVQCDGESSKRLYATEGVASFTVYSPSYQANAKRKAELIVKALRKAFRAPRVSSLPWFRAPRISDMYPFENFLRTNLVVEFYYTEVE